MLYNVNSIGADIEDYERVQDVFHDLENGQQPKNRPLS